MPFLILAQNPKTTDILKEIEKHM